MVVPEKEPVAAESVILAEPAEAPEPDGLSLQSPNLAQQSALATFEAQQVRYKTVQQTTCYLL